jgi:hypothetical protein
MLLDAQYADSKRAGADLRAKPVVRGYVGNGLDARFANQVLSAPLFWHAEISCATRNLRVGSQRLVQKPFTTEEQRDMEELFAAKDTQAPPQDGDGGAVPDESKCVP